MKERVDLKSKLINLVITNIMAFVVIFLVFGIFIFLMVRNITFSDVDNELLRSKDLLLSVKENGYDIIFQSNRGIMFMQEDDFENFSERLNKNFDRRIINPNIIIIRRDLGGNIINSDELGRLEEYIGEIGFDTSSLDKIYEIRLMNKYAYRGISFVTSGNSDAKYIQLLINVDNQLSLVNKYFIIITMAIAGGIILSILASYIVSKKTLKPLQENMEKQIEFVQNASHELRTPLTIIQAKQELLLQEPNAKIIDKSEDISLTLSETKRLSNLVKDLMVLSRADSNKMVLTKENVNIDEFITNLVIPYQEIAELENKKLNLDLNYKLDIDVDTNKFYELMIILLDNALKYTEEENEITVKTSLKENKCVIEVIDTGIGVSDEGLERIFERFYREDKARSRETGGSGLGLSIADFIVTEHGGSIKASHNAPKGTIFTIKLPR